MSRWLIFKSISLSMGICLIGCTESNSNRETKSIHDRSCSQLEKKRLEESAKYVKGRVSKMGKEGVFVQCDCLTKGLMTILTSEQFEEMEDLMSKAASGSGIGVRNDYLVSLLPRGTRFKDRPFEAVKSTCKDYMKVWRNSYSSRDVYMPPPPY